MRKFKKNTVLLCGLACITFLPKTSYAVTVNNNLAMSPCEDGNMTIYLGDKVELSLLTKYDSNVYENYKWYTDNTKVLDTKIIGTGNGYSITANSKGKAIVTSTYDFYNFQAGITEPVELETTCEVVVLDLVEELTVEGTKVDLDKEEYTVEVDNSVDSVVVDAKLYEGSKSEFVKDFGPRTVDLDVGENKVLIKARRTENNYEKEYTLNIIRKEAEDISQEEDSTLNQDSNEENEEEVKNPSTGDLNITLISLICVSVFGLAGLSVYKLRKN